MRPGASAGARRRGARWRRVFPWSGKARASSTSCARWPPVADAVDILYISYNGIDEPLVQSQVLNYLRVLSQRGYRFTLLTFERRAIDAAARERLAELGIDWYAVLACRGWGALSTLLDVLRGTSAAERLQRQRPMRLLHARSFIPAVIAWRLGLPFVNDLRGFWVDEKVYRGRLRQDGMMYRVAKALESRVLRASAAIVSLSDRGAKALREFGAWQGRPLPPVTTIPTCVDTGRFVPQERQRTASRVFGYVGSLSAEYLPDRILAYFAAALRRFPGSRLRLITRSDPAPILALAESQGLPPDSVRQVAQTPV